MPRRVFWYRHPHLTGRIFVVAGGFVLIWDLIVMLMQVSSAPW
jgi:hypothetical protein